MKSRFSKRKRVFVFFIGIVLSGFGVALSTRPGLGTTPISSLPYVVTFIIPWTLGICTTGINVIFLLLQIAILRRRFQWFQLSQLGTVALFGLFIDLGMWFSGFWTPQLYWLRLAEELIGCAVLALGIALQLLAEISYLPGDGVVRVIAREFRFNFGTVKVCFDSSMVLLAVLLSWCCFQSVEGIREGTLLAAVLVGCLIRWYRRPLRRVKLAMVKA